VSGADADESGGDGGETGSDEGSGDGDGTQGEDGGITRRRMLLGGGASLGALGGGKALYNTTLGYGQFGMGTNLLDQDLPSVVTEYLELEYDETIDGVRVRSTDAELSVDGSERLTVGEDDPEDAAAVDSEFGLGGRLRELFVDLAAFRAGEYAFEFHQPEAFFDRLEGADPRSGIVAAIRDRRDRTVDPETVGTFAGVDPAETAALVEGLVEGFRKHTRYDVPRYIAGSIEDNVLLGTVDLRQYFEADVSFEALLEADTTGIFCWELVYRSIEALQAVAPDRQSVPVAACYVSDRRHKHAFTGLLAAVRENGELRLPMTFVDYTHTTMYDDFGVRGLLGEGLAAYGDGHRADEIYW
jgi:hypothetical protein